MRMTLESTSRIVLVNGYQARVWEGKTDAGVRVYALVPRLAVLAQDDQTEFEQNLQSLEGVAPSVEAGAAFPARMVL